MAEADEATLDQVAEELYGLPPEEFTAARDAVAKAAGDRDTRDAVKALRRPTVSAWLVNRLAQDQTDLLEQLLALGPALAQAQSTGAADDLRALGQQRRELVAAVTAAAVDLSGRDIAAAARTEVEQTLEAALADPASADAVRSGRLVRALSFAGFGGVDLEGAVAVTPITPISRRAGKPRAASKQRPAEDRAAASAAAEQAALDAAAALDDAVRAGEAAQRDRTAAVESAARAEREVDNAVAAVAEHERQLAAARERHGAAIRSARQAKQQAAAAGRVADHAVRAVERAQEAAEQARAALDALRRGRS